MIEIADPGAMLRWSRETRQADRTIGLVPTMGFLHEGHLRLIDRARREADTSVVSVFVNPIQFGPNEDFSDYPRDLARDREAAELRGTDCLFVPEPDSMYVNAPSIRVSPGSLGTHLCGPARPGHFEGVLTVVAKLLATVQPDVAVFGRKDFQQARLIEKMVEDLSFPVCIVVAPTVREHDGLAMSSRNIYLSRKERTAAAKLASGLESAHAAFRSGTRRSGALEASFRAVVDVEPLIRLEYVQVVDPALLQPVERAEADSVVAVAARVGTARLIDNAVLGIGISADPREAA
jgi:pantoate--beta-alanine ligase